MPIVPDFSDSPGAVVPPEGDPILRTLVALVDTGAVRHVRITLKVAGLVLSGMLVPTDEYASEVSELLNENRLSSRGYITLRDQLRTNGPDEAEPPAARAEAVTHVHLRRDDPNPQAWQKNRLNLWRSPFTFVDGWTLG